MTLGKLIKEIVENEALMETLVSMQNKKNGIISEFEKDIKDIGTSAHVVIPKEFRGLKANIQIIKKSEDIEQS